MSRYGRSAVCLLACVVAGGTYLVAEVPTAAAVIMQAARATGRPVGVVLREGNDLCAVAPDTPGATEAVPSSATPLERLRATAESHGYQVDMSGPVLLVLPNGGGPNTLEAALAHYWPIFPAQDELMGYLGMELSGWMNTVASPTRGFAISYGSNPEEPKVHLNAGENVTSQQVADRIVSLGPKGIWIAWQKPPKADKTPGSVQLRTFAYSKYYEASFQHFRCE